MYPGHCIPILYPVRLSVTTTQRAAEGEVRLADGATASTVAPLTRTGSEVGFLLI